MDSRFPTYYLNNRDILRATPEAFRLFVFATAWSVSNMTDGKIPEEDLPLIPMANTNSADELVKRGLWKKEGAEWIISDFAKTQTSAAQLEANLLNRRKADAERQAKRRAKLKEQAEAEAKESPKSRDTNVITPTDYPTSRERHVTLEGRGKEEEEEEARTKEPTNSEQSFDSKTGEVFEPASDPWNTSDPWGNQDSSSDPVAEFYRRAGRS